MKKNIANGIAVLIALLPLAYLAFIWNSLPQIVPLHFNYEMKPDRMGDKGEIWLVAGIMAGVSLFTYFLINNIHRIDPKRKNSPKSGTFNKLAVGLVIFLAALNFIIISSIKGSIVMQNLLFPLLGLLFAFLGNYMNNIKPNYFAGFRLPWTLSDDENWRKTHHLAGKLWFAGGLLIAIAGVVIPTKLMLPFFTGIMLIIGILPMVYSYRQFKNKTTV